ncbi:MAG: PilZ domain-containing protein [Candidatus Eremiobacteraeota bacterium]|nr:PilZ domain-containing protein [Candidatus Eremiobacteraeota bacterium]
MFATGTPSGKSSDVSNRRHFRLQLRYAIDIVVPSVAVPVPSTLADISEGGARVVSKTMLMRGTEISFDLERAGKAAITIHGTVASVEYIQANKEFHYGVKFRALRPADTDSIYQFIVEQQRRGLKTKDEQTRGTHQASPLRSAAQRSAYRVERMFTVRFSVAGMRGIEHATVLDTSIGGMRIAFSRALHLDREIELRFTLPSDVLDVLTRREASRDKSIFGRTVAMKEVKARVFSELQVRAKVLPQAQEVNGKFFYSVSFVRASTFVSDELQRFVHAAQLTELAKKRQAQDPGRRLA